MPTIYLDNAASTRPAEEALVAAAEAAATFYANPSSLHGAGAAAARRLEAAREELAVALTGGEGHASEVVFTSGGSEANALAILGRLSTGARDRAANPRPRQLHVVVSAIEHPSVLRNVRDLDDLAAAGERADHAVTVVRVGRAGMVRAEDVVEAVRPETALVAVMHVNNELGTVQPVAEIARALQARAARTGTRKPHLHVDAVQSFGHLGLRVGSLGADSVAVSAHKIHGPRGVGALWVRAPLRAGLTALWNGGRQEGGLRSGTENLPGAVGFACAARLAMSALARGEEARLAALRDRFERAAFAAIPELRPTVAGHGEAGAPAAPTPRAPHISSVFVPGLPAEPLLHALEARGVMVSAGSACASRQRGPSHVLDAIGLDTRVAVLRFSLSRETTEAELDAAVHALKEAIAELGANPRRARMRPAAR